MKLKSYFAESVDAALSQASRDLGPDAVLLNSRRTNADHKQLGEYEVVCGVTNEPPSDPGSTAPHADAAAKTDDLDQLAHEILGLRQQIERLSLTYSRSSASMSALAENPELLKVFMTLTDAGLEGELAHEVIRCMRPETSLDSARAALADLITIDSGIGKLNSDQCVCALIGPPGSGKTTALVSMAVRFSVAVRKPCQILTLDLHRVAAAEQLRTYAAILGVGFQLVETPAAFAQTLKSIGSQYIILIDTPGLSRAEMEYGSELARIFSKFPEIDTHLVLPASMQSARSEEHTSELQSR